MRTAGHYFFRESVFLAHAHELIGNWFYTYQMVIINIEGQALVPSPMTKFILPQADL